MVAPTLQFVLGPRRIPRAAQAARWCVLLLLCCFPASPAHAAVAVIRGAAASRDPAAAPIVDEAARAVEGSLDRIGIPYRRLDDTGLSDAALRPYDVVILPYNELPPGAIEVLRRFIERGGRWVAYLTTARPAVPALDEALDLRPAPAVQGFQPRSILPAQRLGMPVRVPLTARPLFRAVVPGDPAHAAGQWAGASGYAALVRGPYGYFVNTLPLADPAHTELLLAMLADLDPPVWEEALKSARARARDAVEQASLRWLQRRNQSEFTEEQRDRIEFALRAIRWRIPPAEAPSLELEENRQLLASRVQAALAIRNDVERLCWQMTLPRKGEVRGIWISPTERMDWDAVMRKVRDAGLNCVFVRAGRGGSAIYASDVLPLEGWAEGGPDQLKAAIDAAHKYGLAFHAWRMAFQMRAAPPAFYQRMEKEDRLARDAAGKAGQFLNPGDPRNLDQEVQAAVEIVRKYDVDGIHLDSLCYPDEPHFDWDYGAVSRREFEKAGGKAVDKWPGDVISGARKQEYEDWERGNINRLVEKVAGEVKKLKPHLLLSAQVLQEHRLARASVKQDWPLWADRGWIDLVVPLDDTREHDSLAAAVDAQVSTAGGRIPVVAGIGSEHLASPLDVVRQVEAAREQGADGFALYSYEARDLDDQLTALRVGATAEGTWLAYLAPHANWSLPTGLEQKDAPTAFMLGERVQLELKLTTSAQLRSALKGVKAELRLEDPYGRMIATAGTFAGFTARRFRVEVPAGRFRPVLRGVMISDDSLRPFVIRGPLCDGMSPEELASLRARENAPMVGGTDRKVAVYAGGPGWQALLAALKPLETPLDITAFPLHRLRPDHLAAIDALVLPPLADVQDLDTPAVQALRQWVANGGTLVLLSDAVGARWHPRLFPEVGAGGELSTSRSVAATVPLGDLKAGEPWTLGSPEHFEILRAPGTTVLLKEADNRSAPVAVSGKVGKGRVVLYGAAPGVSGGEIGPTERAFLGSLVAAVK